MNRVALLTVDLLFAFLLVAFEILMRRVLIDRQVKNAIRLAADGTPACTANERPFRPLLNGCCISLLRGNRRGFGHPSGQVFLDLGQRWIAGQVGPFLRVGIMIV